jgi:ABC-type nitrate/sulfonate/bicarbonate transport system substrate-binding protein
MLDKIAVGTVSRTFFSMPLWIGQERGFFADAGLAVTTTVFGNAAQAPMLLDRSLQFVVGSPEGVLANAAGGGPLRLIAGNAGKLVHSLIARAPFARIEELRGAKIGILSPKEGTVFALRTMLAAHGLHFPGDYAVTETGGVPPRHQALLDGTIDAGLQSVPWNYVAEDAGLRNLGEVIDYVPDWQFVSINADIGWAASNSDLVCRFLRAMLRGTAWLYENRAASAEIAARELPAPRAHAERAWDYFTGRNALTRDLAVNMAGLAEVLAALRNAGLMLPDAPSNAGFYVDESFLRDARQAVTGVTASGGIDSPPARPGDSSGAPPTCR